MQTTNKKSVGVGDTIAKATKATGIDKAVKWLAGEDCGCNERRKKLNELFPYRGTQCLTEKEYIYLSKFFADKSPFITSDQQRQLLQIYNRVFNTKKKATSCAPCVRTLADELQQLVNTYHYAPTKPKRRRKSKWLYEPLHGRCNYAERIPK